MSSKNIIQTMDSLIQKSDTITSGDYFKQILIILKNCIISGKEVSDQDLTLFHILSESSTFQFIDGILYSSFFIAPIFYYYEDDEFISIFSEKECQLNDYKLYKWFLKNTSAEFVKLILTIIILNKSPNEGLKIMRETMLELWFEGYGETQFELKWSISYNFKMRKIHWENLLNFLKYKPIQYFKFTKKPFVALVHGDVRIPILNDGNEWLAYLSEKRKGIPGKNLDWMKALAEHCTDKSKFHSVTLEQKFFCSNVIRIIYDCLNHERMLNPQELFLFETIGEETKLHLAKFIISYTFQSNNPVSNSYYFYENENDMTKVVFYKKYIYFDDNRLYTSETLLNQISKEFVALLTLAAILNNAPNEMLKIMQETVLKLERDNSEKYFLQWYANYNFKIQNCYCKTLLLFIKDYKYKCWSFVNKKLENQSYNFNILNNIKYFWERKTLTLGLSYICYQVWSKKLLIIGASYPLYYFWGKKMLFGSNITHNNIINKQCDFMNILNNKKNNNSLIKNTAIY